MRREAEDDRVASHGLDTWNGKDAGSAHASVRMQAGRLCTFGLEGEAKEVRKARMEIDEQGRVRTRDDPPKRQAGRFAGLSVKSEAQKSGPLDSRCVHCRDSFGASCRAAAEEVFEKSALGAARRRNSWPCQDCRVGGASIFARTSDAKCAVIPGAEQVVGEWGILRKKSAEARPSNKETVPSR